MGPAESARPLFGNSYLLRRRFLGVDELIELREVRLLITRILVHEVLPGRTVAYIRRRSVVFDLGAVRMVEQRLGHLNGVTRVVQGGRGHDMAAGSHRPSPEQ